MDPYEKINLGGKLYSVNDVIGKSIIASKDTPIYRRADDSTKAVFTAKKGQSIGVVWSFIRPGELSRYSWLMFEDNNRRPYYIKTDNVAAQTMTSQGAKDTETKAAEEEHANQSARDFWSNKGLTLAAILAAAYLLKDPISKLIAGK